MQLNVINLENKNIYSIEIKQNGENAMQCPVCSQDRKKTKVKCFSYNTEKNAGHCNHCGITLVKKHEFVSHYNKPNYKKPLWKNITELSDKVIKWFEGRKISQKTLSDLKITEGEEFMPQEGKVLNTIQFNYFMNDELINIKYRDAKKNFKLVSGAELILYNIDAVKNETKVVVVEGEIDVLSFYEAGIKNVVSVPNGANLNKNNLTYIDNCIDYFADDTEFYLALDNDAAGNRLRDELAHRFGVEKCYKVFFKDCKDANECLVKYGIQGLIDSICDRQEYPLKGVFTASSINEQIDDYYLNGLPKGTGIGLPEFDSLLKFHRGYITTITGIPGHGKSEVLDFICTRLNVVDGWKFALYSPENYPLQLHFSKFAERLIGKPFSGQSRMNQTELDLSKKYFDDNFFFIKPEEDFSLENILKMVKSLVRKKGISAFVIDAWNKLEHLYETNETQYVSKQLDKISLFCEINNVHAFVVAHPTKIQKDKNTGYFDVPTLYSISGSANFYNKSSNGITAYRNYESGKTDIYIQKVKFKHWGQSGQVSLLWDRVTGRYYSNLPDYSNWITKEGVQPEIEYPVAQPSFMQLRDFHEVSDPPF